MAGCGHWEWLDVVTGTGNGCGYWEWLDVVTGNGNGCGHWEWLDEVSGTGKAGSELVQVGLPGLCEPIPSLVIPPPSHTL